MLIKSKMSLSNLRKRLTGVSFHAVAVPADEHDTASRKDA
jgi:hypothetical protein